MPEGIILSGIMRTYEQMSRDGLMHAQVSVMLLNWAIDGLVHWRCIVVVVVSDRSGFWVASQCQVHKPRFPEVDIT